MALPGPECPLVPPQGEAVPPTRLKKALFKPERWQNDAKMTLLLHSSFAPSLA